MARNRPAPLRRFPRAVLRARVSLAMTFLATALPATAFLAAAFPATAFLAAASLALGCASGTAIEAEAQRTALQAEAQRAARLEREVGRLRRDLARAETAMVAAESGLRESYSRAEVVSAAAEARIQVDRAEARLPWRPQMIEEARDRLDACQQQLAEEHLGAAMYYARLATSTAEGALIEATSATADPNAVRVNAPRVNLRAGPSTEDSVLSVLVAGTPVFPQARSGAWTRVRTPGGDTGWIHTTLLTDPN